MKFRKNWSDALFFWSWFSAAFLTVSVSNACAYIDPGSGSQFLQLLAAGLLAGLYGIKVFWRRIVDFFKKCLNRIRR